MKYFLFFEILTKIISIKKGNLYLHCYQAKTCSFILFFSPLLRSFTFFSSHWGISSISINFLFTHKFNKVKCSNNLLTNSHQPAQWTHDSVCSIHTYICTAWLNDDFPSLAAVISKNMLLPDSLGLGNKSRLKRLQKKGGSWINLWTQPASIYGIKPHTPNDVP